jgi:hypothetical protein
MINTNIKGKIGKKKKLKLAVVRRTNQCFIERLFQKMQGLISIINLDGAGFGITIVTSTVEGWPTTAADRSPD